MRKQELRDLLNARKVQNFKSWTTKRLEQALRDSADKLAVYHVSDTAEPGGNWTTARDWFPTIEIEQSSRSVTVTSFDTAGYQKRASISTDDLDIEVNPTGDSVFVRGEVSCSNYRNGKCSGSQKFCFAIFVGDSGHIYVHRAPATKGWMECDPDQIRARLVKLGIGTVENVVQQGDFLLKPANGAALPDDEFKHETMGAGHHNFEMPVLYASGPTGRQYKIVEPTRLIHTAVDGIKHPDVTVPAGIWVVGTTASQLSHANARD